MKRNLLIITAALAAATLGSQAYARDGDRGDHGRGWDHRHEYREQRRDDRDYRHDRWREHERREEWRYNHRPPPYAYGYGYYRPAPRYDYERPTVYVPLPPLILPPPPHVVLRELFGH